MPGARDRDGLPESIRFWKNRIEQLDADRTFSVGLIYGPSGCGKSSLVKAGLVPRLSEVVLPIYIEATPDDTEVRILKQIRKRVPRLSEGLSLRDTFEELRKAGAGRNRKLLLVVDQFEQWLHTHTDLSQSQLVNALRQCDGGRLQTIVLVRDDFFASVHRLFQELESPLLEGINYALVDRFDKQHASKVLKAFGRAYGKLEDDLSSADERFIDRSINELAEDDKVISVRLSLFADMLKLRPWTVASLEGMGGVSGVGVTFLEETFNAKTAPPAHRVHEAAIRKILKTLLPEAGSDIKGGMRSVRALRKAAGYANDSGNSTDSRQFDEVIRILDTELRIVTPTDPDGESQSQSQSRTTVPSRDTTREESSPTDQPDPRLGQSCDVRFYQLTHDYLVPSLREWLTRKQRETRKGRAELKLAERSAAWTAKPETRYLPSLFEWLNIRTLTESKNWTDNQRAMMGRAFQVHGLRTGFVLATVLAISMIGSSIRQGVLQQQEETRVEGLVGQLISAAPAQLPGVLHELDASEKLAAKHLTPLIETKAETAEQRRTQLHARLARVAQDDAQVTPLVEEMLTNNQVAYIGPIRQRLKPHASELASKLTVILRDGKESVQRRFRAGIALADYASATDTWSWTELDLIFMADQLIASNAENQPLLRELLRPMRASLISDLERIFSDPKATEHRQVSAANAIADYAATDTQKLAMLLTTATPEQYAILFPLVALSPSPDSIAQLAAITGTLPTDDLGSVERVPYGQRRAGAAITMLRLGEREKVLSIFEMTDDPEALTQFIHRCRERAVRVEELLDCLRLVTEADLGRYPFYFRYALLLALGEYSLQEIPEAARETLSEQLGTWYRNDPSSGVHGASGWLLRKWGQTPFVQAVDQTAVAYSPDREWFTLAVSVLPTATKNEDAPEKPTVKAFYYTFVVFPAGKFEIGSLNDETDRQKDEVRHTVNLTRPFALLDREVTLEELIAFSTKYAEYMNQLDASIDDAGSAVDWYDSVAFCRWLSQNANVPEEEQSYADPASLSKEIYPREPNPVANWAPRDWPLKLEKSGFRLPTESEWDVASRAGSRNMYGQGGDVRILPGYGWYQQNSDKHVHPPKGLRPSLRGMFDMHGNLNEWTHDWYNAYPTDASVDRVVDTGGSYRVSRGGGWFNGAAFCRSASRNPLVPTYRPSDLGFRLALSPSEPDGKAEPAEQRPEMP